MTYDGMMRALLVSTYELGHQPLHVASPAGALIAAGHEVATLDLAVERLTPGLLDGVDVVAISVPMHTAMRLGVTAARAIREARPTLPIAFYGLYAAMSGDPAVDRLADAVIAGEYEEELVGWVSAGGGELESVEVGKTTFTVPARQTLPLLDQYAHLSMGEEHRLAGYVEASHGCRHRCRHCPIPAIYDGTYRTVDVETVVADVDQLVAAGARHVTLGDPDFLNGPHHARRVLSALHGRHPDLTFDLTIKVEHLLKHRNLLPDLASWGTVFIVSAFESTNDEILHILDKGHSVGEMATATELVRAAGIELRPTWLPFTPWTTLQDMVDLFDFLALHDLFGSVDPIQTAIRLLVPRGSLLVGHPALEGVLGPYDAGALSYPWVARDPRLDELQLAMSRTVENAIDSPAGEVIQQLWTLVLEAAGRPFRDLAIPSGALEGRPRLTEPWFC